MAARRVLAIASTFAAACAGAPRAQPHWPDAPVALRDDADRDQAIDHLWVMPLGPERDRARSAIAAATARRISDAVDDDQPFVAAGLLDQLTWMWEADPGTVGAGLADQATLLHQLRTMFAKSGAMTPTVQTIVLLTEIEPEQRAAHVAELDEILAFADDLAVTENGANARRAQPIGLLQPTALALPLPWLVDRYVGLLEERQRIVTQLIDQQGASMEIVRAHHDILSTARRIANVLARAGRPAEIYRHLNGMKGIGSDREVTMRAEVVADAPTAAAYEELATVLRSDEHAPDAAAALATCLAGLDKYPRDAGLLAAAGGDARALGRIDQAIALYEAALAGSNEIDTASALRLGKLYGEKIARLASAGRPAAATTVWHDVERFTQTAASKHAHTVWQQTAAIAESALGRGLASQGLVDEASHELTASLDRAPSIDAFETLTMIDAQTDRFSDAQRWAAGGLALLGESTSGDRYRRAKLERIAGDATRHAGKTREAATHYLDSMRAWASLGETKDLPRAIAAERWLDSGRASWWLGDQKRAVEYVMLAVDAESETPSLPGEALAFLIEAGRYRDAVDVFHRGLGAPNVSELYKVYMALWIEVEAHRRGLERDRLGHDYLDSRRGDVWYERLAQLASGRITLATIAPEAKTGPQRAELTFYAAMLGLDHNASTRAGLKQLLERVVDGRLVFDAEYDLARMYLALLASGESIPLTVPTD